VAGALLGVAWRGKDLIWCVFRVSGWIRVLEFFWLLFDRGKTPHIGLNILQSPFRPVLFVNMYILCIKTVFYNIYSSI